MENQEHENIMPDESSVPGAGVPQQSEEQGFYHGVGTGQKETTAASGGPFAYSYAPQPQGQQPPWQPYNPVAQPPQQPSKPQKKKGTGKRIVAALLVVALVLCSSLITGLTVAAVLRNENATLKLYFNEKLQILSDRLEKLEGVGEGEGPLETPEDNLTASQVFERNIQSVVAITCNVNVNSGFGQVIQSTSSGSGFVMSADGYIITNHHVIDGAQNGKITVTFHDGTKYVAKLIGSDASSDIALLKIDATDLRPVTIGKSSSLAVGDQVVAIGNALGELSFSLTVGYVSGIDRDVNTDGSMMSMLQTDAAINSGNSGGPLFNAKGEVIGINTAKYSGTTSSGASIEGISFAIPMDDVIGMLEDLRDFGYIKGASMGVYVKNVDAADAEMYNLPMGVYVQDVIVGKAAERAGIQARDIITELGGYKIENMNDLTRALRNFEGGQTATVTVWRGGTEKILTITFDEKTPS